MTSAYDAPPPFIEQPGIGMNAIAAISATILRGRASGKSRGLGNEKEHGERQAWTRQRRTPKYYCYIIDIILEVLPPIYAEQNTSNTKVSCDKHAKKRGSATDINRLFTYY